jgi:hypothetical protein
MTYVRALFRVLRYICILVIHALILFFAWRALLEVTGWGRFLDESRHPITNLLLELFPFNFDPEVKYGKLLTQIVLVVLVGLPVFYWMGRVIGAMHLKRDVLKVKTPDGHTMLLNPSSMKMFVKVQLDSHQDVVSHSIKVAQVGSHGLRINGYVDVESVRSLPEIEAELVALLKSSFQKIMGIDRVEDIKLIMGLPKKSLKRFSAIEGTPAAAPEAPIRGTLDLSEAETEQEPVDDEPKDNALDVPDSAGSDTVDDELGQSDPTDAYSMNLDEGQQDPTAEEEKRDF